MAFKKMDIVWVCIVAAAAIVGLVVVVKFFVQRSKASSHSSANSTRTDPEEPIFKDKDFMTSPHKAVVGDLHSGQVENFEWNNDGMDGMEPVGDDANDAPIEGLF